MTRQETDRQAIITQNGNLNRRNIDSKIATKIAPELSFSLHSCQDDIEVICHVTKIFNFQSHSGKGLILKIQHKLCTDCATGELYFWVLVGFYIQGNGILPLYFKISAYLQQNRRLNVAISCKEYLASLSPPILMGNLANCVLVNTDFRLRTRWVLNRLRFALLWKVAECRLISSTNIIQRRLYLRKNFRQYISIDISLSGAAQFEVKEILI